MNKVWKPRVSKHDTDQGACVSGVSRSVVQKARQAKVGDLADQVAVDQDIPGGEVSVDVVHVWQVLHPCRDATQHPDQLRHREATVVQLRKHSGRRIEGTGKGESGRGVKEQAGKAKKLRKWTRHKDV